MVRNIEEFEELSESEQILESLCNKVMSDTCTILELFNIKMYLGSLSGSLQRVAEQEIRDQEELKEIERESDIKKIRTFKWPAGKHFYAKIGNIDVVDKNGEVKWNSDIQARKAAKWFIENLI